jgi:hypothetical protein
MRDRDERNEMTVSAIPTMSANCGGDVAHRAPFLLGYAETERAMRNNITVGALILIGAFFWGFRELRNRG